MSDGKSTFGIHSGTPKTNATHRVALVFGFLLRVYCFGSAYSSSMLMPKRSCTNCLKYSIGFP